MRNRQRLGALVATIVLGSGVAAGVAGPAGAIAEPMVPGAPTGVTATPQDTGIPGYGQVTVSYSPPVSDGGSAILEYTASCVSSDGGDPGSASAASGSIVVIGLWVGRTYTCTVTARNAVGTGPASVPSAPVVPIGLTVPGAPTGVTVTPGEGQVTVSYTPPASDGGSAIVEYWVSCEPSAGGIPGFGEVDSGPIVIGPLTKAKTYTCRVQAVNVYGGGPWSAPSAPVAVLGFAPVGIDNGTVQIGIYPTANLGVPGVAPPTNGYDQLGLRYLPTNGEALNSGCVCEGWGVADAVTSVSGYVNLDYQNLEEETVNVAPVSQTSTLSTAVMVNRIGDTFLVTHDFHPSSSANLYEVTVTIENISAAAVEARYRRVVDWDIDPTQTSEYVTIETGNASQIIFTSDNGFADSNPLVAPGYIRFEGEATDSGPWDHGAIFDFDFGTLAPGAEKTFQLYYGAAATESEVLTGLVAVGAEAYSLAKPSDTGGRALGQPNTFALGFKGVGGSPMGLLSVVDDTVPNGAQDFSYSLSGAGSAAFTLDDDSDEENGKSKTFALAPGTYTVTEGAASGWNLSAIACSAGGSGNPVTRTATVAVTSGATVTCTFTNSAVTVPGAPTGVMATRGNGSLSVAFAAGSTGGSPITSFGVSCVSSDGGVAGSGSRSVAPFSPIVVSGLTNGKSYTCTVRATNVVGQGPASSPSAAVVPATVPGAPTGVVARSGSTTSATGPLVVSFSAGSAGGRPITSFGVSCVSSNGGAARTGSGAGSPITVAGATTGRSYTCTVRATNVVGTGVASVPSGAVIVGSPPAPTLTGVTRPFAGQLRVAYTPNGNNGSVLTGFTAGCVSSNGGVTRSVTVVNPALRAITVTGLSVGKTYTCKVRAVNARGTGLPSNQSGAKIA